MTGEEDTRTCAFCGKNHDEVPALIAGPKVDICDECVAILQDILQTDGAKAKDVLVKAGNQTSNASHLKLYCSFCGKEQSEVARLIAGGIAFICDECIERCAEHIKNDPA